MYAQEKTFLIKCISPIKSSWWEFRYQFDEILFLQGFVQMYLKNVSSFEDKFGKT